EVLAGELGDPIRRVRPRLRLLRGRIALGVTVDRRRTRIDDLRRAGRLEEPLRCERVPAQIVREDRAKTARAGLAGEVEDCVHASEVELRLRQVEALHLEPGRVLLLQR